MTLEIAITLAALVGLFFGSLVGVAIGIKDERKKKNAHYTRLINSAMENAYNAGYVDAKTDKAKRPSGNGGK